MGWELVISSAGSKKLSKDGKAFHKKPSAYADPKDLSKVPQKLVELRSDYLGLKDDVGTTSYQLVSSTLKDYGLAGQQAEILRIVADGLSRLPGIEKHTAPLQLVRNLEVFFDLQGRFLESVKKGISFKLLCHEVWETARRSRQVKIESFRERLIAYVKTLPAIDVDPYRDSKDDINACRITPEIVRNFLNTLSQGIRGSTASVAKGLWKEAAKSGTFDHEGESRLKDNPWQFRAPRNTKDDEEDVICVLSAEQTYAVLMDLSERGSPAFLPVLAEFTLGARPAESSWGMTIKIRIADKLKPIRVSDFHFDGSGIHGLGTVTVPTHKTRKKGKRFRTVDLTPFAYTFWKPIIMKFRDLGLHDNPIFTGCYGTVQQERRRCFKRLGILKYFADKFGRSNEDFSGPRSPMKDIGRHTYLTALYFYAVHKLKMPMIYVRHQAGHEDATNTLEKHYLGLSSPSEAERYIHMTAPINLAVDPLGLKWKEKVRQAKTDRIKAQHSPEQTAKRIAAAVAGKKKFDTAPEFKEAREKAYKKLSQSKKARWKRLDPAQRDQESKSIRLQHKKWWESLTDEEQLAHNVMLQAKAWGHWHQPTVCSAYGFHSWIRIVLPFDTSGPIHTGF